MTVKQHRVRTPTANLVLFAGMLTFISPAWSQLDTGPMADPVWVRPLTELRAYREHPLFTPNRRPSPTPASPDSSLPQTVNETPFDGILVGIILQSDGTGFALVRQTEGDSVTRVPLGGSYKDWTLSAIKRHSATFTSGDANIVVTLDKSTPPPAQ